MTDVDNIPARYASAEDALRDLANLSRMLELARGYHVQVERACQDMDRLIAQLMKDRAGALRAIDAMTEVAPRSAGIEISPFVERSGESMGTEVVGLLQMAAEIVEKAGGLQ